jgi:hypothetical protein
MMAAAHGWQCMQGQYQRQYRWTSILQLQDPSERFPALYCTMRSPKAPRRGVRFAKSDSEQQLQHLVNLARDAALFLLFWPFTLCKKVESALVGPLGILSGLAQVGRLHARPASQRLGARLCWAHCDAQLSLRLSAMITCQLSTLLPEGLLHEQLPWAGPRPVQPLSVAHLDHGRLLPSRSVLQGGLIAALALAELLTTRAGMRRLLYGEGEWY